MRRPARTQPPVPMQSRSHGVTPVPSKHLRYRRASKQVKALFARGVPSAVRCRVWPKGLGNPHHITEGTRHNGVGGMAQSIVLEYGYGVCVIVSGNGILFLRLRYYSRIVFDPR